MFFSELIDKALRFAAKAHEGQFRKGSDHVPYFAHCCAVGMILKSLEQTEEVVAAGILHDTVEDTSASLEDIQKEFGANIARLVGEVSDPANLPFAVRKAHQISYLKNASPDVKLIKAADILHNLYSKVLSGRRGENIWQYMDNSREEALSAYRKILQALAFGWQSPLLSTIEIYVKELESQKYE